MPDTITLPGVGTQPKKTVYIAVAGVVVLGLVGYYRRKKAAAAAPATTASQIDPATGFAYGSAEDAAALSSQAAYQTPVGGGGGGLDFSSGTALTSGGVAVSTTYADNGAWERAAVDFLVGTIGLAPSAVSGALGKYLAGQGVTAAEQDIIHQAIAAIPGPPQAGTNGYPPSIRQVVTSSTGGTPQVADGYYRGNPSGTRYYVQGNKRWRLSSGTVSRLHDQSYHPITDTSINKLPLAGIK
jgi:hypothetical protein